MEAEYAFNYLLAKRGLSVPEILGADTKSRSILFSYIPGDGLSTLLAKLAQSSQIGQREKEAARTAGLLMASAHELEAALGDTKPRNFIVDRRRRITHAD